MTRVTIENLDRSYGGVRALKEISLEILSGEFVVLLGPSGCGKSTLLSAIAGLDPVQGGRILFDGRDVSQLEPSAREIGMVFQSYALYPTMTARKNMSFALRVGGASAAEMDARVNWAAQLLQIEPLLDRKPGAMSGGQRQRVAIGRALVRKAKLFLFDEPLSNLDAKLRNEMRIEIRSLHDKLGTTFIYVTHDQIEAMTLASRIAVMDRGEIQQFGTPDEIYRRPMTRFVADFIGSPGMSFLDASLDADGAAAALDGGRLPLSGYGYIDPPTGATKVTLGIRPERVIVDRAPGPGRLAARVRGVEPLGADSVIWLNLGGQTLSARVSPDQAQDLPPEVYVAFDLQGISLFDPITGLRL
jgi:multiple sugar transport system ATP-binding protein